ncbi:hypothetical protein HYPSUDRAFT_413361 [Hypholoma sublateritium FD-334 SS-4]|uniref:Uncharacterized protein n=1 Tax=Hypholoma sublateritium (strain FD-334 SS-4) TaxID=945553 RepID=A0A0D2KJR5_HYPSF|nr:hypothetical protein HYPSUDRAFT_413361 [Hypholoma sublateritium FD-334 SS-4]
MLSLVDALPDVASQSRPRIPVPIHGAFSLRIVGPVLVSSNMRPDRTWATRTLEMDTGDMHRAALSPRRTSLCWCLFFGVGCCISSAEGRETAVDGGRPYMLDVGVDAGALWHKRGGRQAGDERRRRVGRGYRRRDEVNQLSPKSGRAMVCRLREGQREETFEVLGISWMTDK